MLDNCEFTKITLVAGNRVPSYIIGLRDYGSDHIGVQYFQMLRRRDLNLFFLNKTPEPLKKNKSDSANCRKSYDRIFVIK